MQPENESLGDPEEITRLLKEWRDGAPDAVDRLFEALIPDLHRIAAAYFIREPLGHTLQPTALVNEAFLRLASAKNIDWQDRGHFLCLAARVMRRYLIDHARSKKIAIVLPMDGLPESMVACREPLDLTVMIDALLDELEKESPQQRAVVDVKFFLGLTDAEGAEVLKLSLHTFQREWYRARRWLFERLTREQPAS